MSLDLAAIAANALFVIEHYLALLLVGVTACAIGRRLTGGVTYKGALEAACFSIALGLGAISFLILLLGMLHLLYPSALIIALSVSLLLSYPVLLAWSRDIRGLNLRDVTRRWRLVLGAGLILGVATPFFVLPLYPAKDWDATQYHLAAPKIYIEAHAVVLTPYLRYPVFPQTNQMLFTGALLLYDDPFAQQIQFLMLLTLGGAMIAFGMRYLTPRAGWWGAALLLASPLVIHLGSIAYVDVGLMLFCFLATFSFWSWIESRATVWLVLAGVFSGLAFGSKYTGAVFPLVFFVSLIWSGWRERRYLPPLILGGVTLLVAGPWLVRNTYYSGNPLFPFFADFFTGIFGRRRIDPEWFRTLIGGSLYIGTGRSLGALLKLPWNMIFHNKVFLPEAPLSIATFVLLPLAVVYSFFSSHVRRLLLIAVSYTIFWFYGYQYVRYLVPAFPLYCLVAAASVDWILSRRQTAAWPNTHLVTAAICVVLVSPSWYYVAQHVRWEGFLPTTRAERERYLAARIPSYPAYQFLNSQIGSNYRVYALDDVKMAYHADGTFLGDWVGEANYARITSKMYGGEALYDELKQLAVNYLLLNSAVEPTKLPHDEFFRRNFRLIFTGNKTEVYELSGEKTYQY